MAENNLKSLMSLSEAKVDVKMVSGDLRRRLTNSFNDCAFCLSKSRLLAGPKCQTFSDKNGIIKRLMMAFGFDALGKLEIRKEFFTAEVFSLSGERTEGERNSG